MRTRLMRDVIDDLIHRIPASRGTAGQRAKGRDARDADGRTKRIRRRRFQIAVRHLRAGFVDRPRRKTSGVAKREGVVDVIETG